METISLKKVFLDAGSIYKEVELEKYKEIYDKQSIKIDTSSEKNLILHLTLINSVCLYPFHTLNNNQMYVLTQHLMFISKYLNTNLEMKKLFYSCLNYLSQLMISNYDTDINMLKWIYRIQISRLTKEKNLELYCYLLDSCSQFFVPELEDVVLDLIMYTFENDFVVQSMINMYHAHQNDIMWSDVEYAMANFLFNASSYVIRNVAIIQATDKWNLTFSKKQFGIAFLLLSSSNEDDVWFLVMYYLSVITHMLTDYTVCTELFTLYNIEQFLSYFLNMNDSEEKDSISYLFLQCINNVNQIKPDVVDSIVFEKIFKFYLKHTSHTRKGIVFEMLTFIHISAYFNKLSKDVSTTVVNFVKQIYKSDINHIEYIYDVLLDAILTLIIGSYLNNDAEFFNTVYNDGFKYIYKPTTCYRYSMVIYKWLFASYTNNWNFNKCVLKNIDILQNCVRPVNIANYIEHVLVNINLFDKCKLVIKENCTKFSDDEMDTFNFLTT